MAHQHQFQYHRNAINTITDAPSLKPIQAASKFEKLIAVLDWTLPLQGTESISINVFDQRSTWLDSIQPDVFVDNP